MASRNFSIVAELIANTSQFTAGMRNAMGSLQELEKSTGNKFQRVGDAVSGVGKALTVGLTAPLAAVGASSVKTATTFDDSMRQVSALIGKTARVGSANYQQLSDRARELGRSTRHSASDVADGMGYMALAGWKTQEIYDNIPHVLNLATAANLDLGRASDIVTDSLTAFGLEAKDTRDFVDILAQTTRNSNTNLEDMGEVFKYVAPTATAAGLGIKDIALVTGLMADNGIKASVAGTALRSGITRLAAPSKQGAKALEELGIQAFDSEGKMKPLTKLLPEMREKFSGMNEQQQLTAAKAIFGQNAMSAWQAILNGTEEDFYTLVEAIESSSGATEEMVDVMEGGIGGAFRNLQSSFEDFKIAIGQALEPVVRDLTTWLNSLIDSFTSLPTPVQENIVRFGLFLAALGPVLWVIGKLISILPILGSVFSFLISPIGLVVVAIAAVVAIGIYLWKNWDTIKPKLIEIWEKIKAKASEIFEGLKRFFVETWENIKTKAGEIWDGIREFLVTKWEDIKTAFSETWEGIKTKASEIWEGIRTTVEEKIQPIAEFIQTTLDTIRTIWELVWENIKVFFAGILLAIVGLVTGDFELVKEAVGNAWEIIKTNTETIWNTIKEFLSNLWEQIKTKVAETVENLKVKIAEGWENMKTTVSNKMTEIKESISQKWEEAKTVVANKLNDIKTSVSQKWEEAKTTVSTKMSEIKTNIQTGWNNAVTAVQNAGPRIVSAVRTAFSNAVSAARTFVSEAVSAGINLISGFVQGVKQAAGRLVSAVKGAVGDAIAGAKALLGIKSPSRVFRKFGQFTDEGFVIGIKKGAGQVVSAMSGMASGAINAFLGEDVAGRIQSGLGAVGQLMTGGFEVPVGIDGSGLPDLNKMSGMLLGSVQSDLAMELGNHGQPIQINLALGRDDFGVFVEDIFNMHERQERYRLRSSST